MADKDKVNPPVPLGPSYTEIVIDGEGEVTVEVHGGHDARTCRNKTKAIEVALGLVTNRVDTTKQKIKKFVRRTQAT